MNKHILRNTFKMYVNPLPGTPLSKNVIRMRGAGQNALKIYVMMICV